MAAPRPLRLAPEWDDRFGRMLGVSALAHALVIAALIVLTGRGSRPPLPLVAYTVELTDPSALGGRVPPGAPVLEPAGGPVQPPAPVPKPDVPEAKVAPPETKPEPTPSPAPAVEAKTEKPAVPEPPKPADVAPEPKQPEPEPLQTQKVEPPKPEPKPEPKLEPKPEPKPEPPKAQPAKPATPKAEPPKPVAAKPEAKPAAPPAPTKPASSAAAPAHPAPPEEAAYTAALERFRARTGGGLEGSDTATGRVGTGGSGAGGGGEVVGLEYVTYNQRIRDVIRSRWTSVVRREGLVAYVYFRIAPDGEVSDVKIQQSSGDPAYDGSVLRAVQQANPLPPPPARYLKEFSEVIVDLHSEEQGG